MIHQWYWVAQWIVNWLSSWRILNLLKLTTGGTSGSCKSSCKKEEKAKQDETATHHSKLQLLFNYSPKISWAHFIECGSRPGRPLCCLYFSLQQLDDAMPSISCWDPKLQICFAGLKSRNSISFLNLLLFLWKLCTLNINNEIYLYFTNGRVEKNRHFMLEEAANMVGW